MKIGYQAGIKLLRAGAQLIVTTRFPRDAAARYARGARLRRLGRPARDLRPRPAPHAERRGVLPAPRARRATGSTSSSTTPARPCAGRPTSTGTCSSAETAAADAMPAHDPPRCSASTRACAAPTSCPRPGRARSGRRAALGVTHSAELSQVAAAPRRRRRAARPLPRGPARPGSAAGRSARPELVAAAARRGVVGRAARGAARERGRAVRPQRAPQAAAAAHARARQAHRQRVGGRGAVLPPLQDDAASAHEHGEGRAEHDDADVRGRLPRRRHPHEQRRHRLGDRRGSRCRSPSARPPSTASSRRSTSSTAPRASSIRSSTASTPASTCGASS